MSFVILLTMLCTLVTAGLFALAAHTEIIVAIICGFWVLFSMWLIDSVAIAESEKIQNKAVTDYINGDLKVELLKTEIVKGDTVNYYKTIEK